MRKRLLIFLLLPIMFMLGLGIVFWIPGEGNDDAFDENTMGIVDVILCEKENSDLLYRAVGPGQAAKNINPFKSDPLGIYRLEKEYEVSEDETWFRVIRTWLEDEDGTEVEITPVFQRILELAEEIDHDILEIYILQRDEHLFAAVELNVNLWSPCVLYYYDAESDALVELITHDAQDYVGLRIRNMENIDAAPQ